MEKCFEEKFHKFKKGKVKTPKVEFFSLKTPYIYTSTLGWNLLRYEYVGDDELIYRWIFDELMTKRMEILIWERNLQVYFRFNMLCLILGLNEIIFGDFSSMRIKHSSLIGFIHVWCVWKCLSSENPWKIGLKLK